MFIFFKTKYSLEIGRSEGNSITTFFDKILNLDISNIMYHPKVRTAKAQSQICLFGKYGAILIFIFLILRNYFYFLKKQNRLVFAIIFIFCFMNYNAMFYMLPIFLIELYREINIDYTS